MEKSSWECGRNGSWGWFSLPYHCSNYGTKFHQNWLRIATVGEMTCRQADTDDSDFIICILSYAVCYSNGADNGTIDTRQSKWGAGPKHGQLIESVLADPIERSSFQRVAFPRGLLPCNISPRIRAIWLICWLVSVVCWFWVSLRQSNILRSQNYQLCGPVFKVQFSCDIHCLFLLSCLCSTSLLTDFVNCWTCWTSLDIDFQMHIYFCLSKYVFFLK